MRSLRHLKAGAIYHVSARANHKEALLESTEAKRLFLKTLRDAKNNYSFNLYHYSLMDNHIHLLLQPSGEDNLSKIMKWILGVFAQRYNKLYGLWGRFWGDRFFSRIIRDAQDFINIHTYIENNPVAAKLVENANDWPWAAHSRLALDTIEVIKAPWMAHHFMIPQLPACNRVHLKQTRSTFPAMRRATSNQKKSFPKQEHMSFEKPP